MCGRCINVHPTVVNEGGSSSQQPSEASCLRRHSGGASHSCGNRQSGKTEVQTNVSEPGIPLQACEMWCSLEGAGVRSSLGSHTSYRRPGPTLESTSARASGPQSTINQRPRYEQLPYYTPDIHAFTGEMLPTWLDCIKTVAGYYIAASTSTLHHPSTQRPLPPKQPIRTSMNRKKSVC
jgi:hypothetical protein